MCNFKNVVLFFGLLIINLVIQVQLANDKLGLVALSLGLCFGTALTIGLFIFALIQGEDFAMLRSKLYTTEGGNLLWYTADCLDAVLGKIERELWWAAPIAATIIICPTRGQIMIAGEAVSPAIVVVYAAAIALMQIILLTALTVNLSVLLHYYKLD